MDCLNTYIQNWILYYDIVREHREDIERDIKIIIEDRSIYTSASDLYNQLKIVGSALDSLQSNQTTFSEAYNIWISLINNENLSIYKSELKKRFKQAMEPFHALAFLTNPIYLLQDKCLSAEEDESVFQWLRENYPTFMPGVLSFTMKDPDVYPRSMFEKEVVNSMKPHKWWCSMKKKFEGRVPSETNTNLINMAEFFIKLHTCPSSSASLERIFSTFGHVWSKLRNKLGPETVQKLVKIYRYYNHHN